MRNQKLEELQRALADKRSRRVVFVSHCILNENVRYLGGAGRRAGVDEVVDGFQAAGAGICQMPCPEQRAWGGVARRWLVPMYGAEGTLRYRLRHPLTWVFLGRTRWVYARLARRVARDAADYARSGFEVAGVVGVGASPSCGVVHTLDVRRSLGVIARCQVASVDACRFNAALLASARTAGEGYFIRALRRALTRRGLDIPFAEHDLAAEVRGGPARAITFHPARPAAEDTHTAATPGTGGGQPRRGGPLASPGTGPVVARRVRR
jgi:uncharacterized protein YbbK (DUF523 family)